MRIRPLLIALMLVTVYSCKEKPPFSRNTLLRHIDTTIEARLYEDIIVKGLNLEATPLTASDQLALLQEKSSLKITPIDTGMAMLKSWSRDGTDTLVRIRIKILADTASLALKKVLETIPDTSTAYSDSIRFILLRYRAVNKPFPNTLQLPEVEGGKNFSTEMLQRKITVIDCWFYG